MENQEELKAEEEKKPRSNVLRIAVYIIVLFVTVLVTMLITSWHDAEHYAQLMDKIAPYNSRVAQVRKKLDKNYLYDIDEKKMVDEAVKAYVDGLDEPYTHYYTKEEFEAYTSSIEDSYVGIGVVISQNDKDQIEVVAPFEGSPAYNAGVLPGDILKAVNGVEYSGSKMQDAINVIKAGEAGTTVDLVISRNGEDIPFTVERGDISAESVKTEMLDGGVGLVRISSFNTNDKDATESTFTEFKEKVNALEKQGMKKMIIDLRDNPGGSLDIVCSIADMIVPEGLITYMEYKNGKREEFKSDANEMNIPIVILINENSASSSEVLTGCLKDYGKAKVVGKKSYGKGIVQTVFPFNDGSGMTITVARYFSPNGVCIHGTGIEPDYDVDMPEKYNMYYASTVPHDEDPQLQKALEVLAQSK